MANKMDWIVVFDSGLGGISVLRELVQEMPNERYLYFGDSANAPYGTRSVEEVRALTMSHIAGFMKRGVKAVVVACNTATSAAIEELRQTYPDTIIVGIEPALKVAADTFPWGRIIVMATPITLREEKFQHQVELFSGCHTIVPLPCPELVEYVEAGAFQETADYLKEKLTPVLTPDTVAVVLGCTHFPFLRPQIRSVIGDKIKILDGGRGTAMQTRRRLVTAGLLNENAGCVQFENSRTSEPCINRMEALFALPFEEL